MEVRTGSEAPDFLRRQEGLCAFAGIDIAAETHVVAVVGANSAVEVKPTPFTEDAAGYQKLFAVLGAPSEVLVAMEATGHYWKNLFAALAAGGFACRRAISARIALPRCDSSFFRSSGSSAPVSPVASSRKRGS